MAQHQIAAKRPRTASRATRRRQLIEATIESISRYGLTGTTMATVTGFADLSMGIVSFHFKSKENLLAETLLYLAEEHRAQWVESLASSELAPAAKLAAIIDAHFHPNICNEDRISVWFAFFGDARQREIYREKVLDFDVERSAVLTEMCQALIDEGGYRGLAAAQVSDNIESLSDGLWLSILLEPGSMTRSEAKRQVHAYLTAVFPRHFELWPGDQAVPQPETPCRRPAE